MNSVCDKQTLKVACTFSCVKYSWSSYSHFTHNCITKHSHCVDLSKMLLLSLHWCSESLPKPFLHFWFLSGEKGKVSCLFVIWKMSGINFGHCVQGIISRSLPLCILWFLSSITNFLSILDTLWLLTLNKFLKMGTTRFGNLSGSQTPGNKLQSNLPYRTPQTSVKPVFSHFSVQPRNVRKRGGPENPSWQRHCETDTKIMVSVTEQNSLRWLFCRSYKKWGQRSVWAPLLPLSERSSWILFPAATTAAHSTQRRCHMPLQCTDREKQTTYVSLHRLVGYLQVTLPSSYSQHKSQPVPLLGLFLFFCLGHWLF